MAHALAGLVQETLGDHLVVNIERAVEEDEIGVADAISKRGIDLGTAWNIEERLAGLRVGYLETDGVAVAATEIRVRSAFFEKQRDFARDSEGFDRQAKVEAGAF